jgi:hypothetical protein
MNMPTASSTVATDNESGKPSTLHEYQDSGVSVYHKLHSHWVIRILLVVVAYLHTQYQVSFRACGALLWVLNVIFTALNVTAASPQRHQTVGSLSFTDEIPTTLTTLFRQLGLQDDFTVYSVCYRCNHLYSATGNIQNACIQCNIPLYEKTTREYYAEALGEGTGSRINPQLQAPIQLLSDFLEEFLARKGIEDEMEAWRKYESPQEHLCHLQDGDVWKTIKDSEGHSFFENPCPKEELRLGITVSLDWFVYFPQSKQGFYLNDLLF